MRILQTTLLTLSWLVISWPETALAEVRGPAPHQLDPEEQALDSTPPGQVTVVAAEVTRRGKGMDCERPGVWSSTSIDGVGSLTIELEPPADDRTDAEHMGYRIVAAGGRVPDGLLPDFDVRAEDGAILLHWDDGDTDDQEPLDFRLTIRAVDLGGNVGRISEPLEIRHPGSGGCSSSDPSPLWLVVLALLGLRRSRQTRTC